MRIEFIDFEYVDTAKMIEVFEVLKPLFPNYFSTAHVILNRNLNAIAQIVVNAEYHSCSIEVGSELLIETREKQLRYLAHEISHIYTTAQVDSLMNVAGIGADVKAYVTKDVEFHTCALAATFLKLLGVDNND